MKILEALTAARVPMTTRRAALALLVVLVVVVPAHAQSTATPTSTFAWDVDAGLAAAQRYTYTLEIDGLLRAGPVPVTCSGTAIATCVTPIPAVTPGTHVLRVRLTDLVDGVPINSEFSAPLTFTMIVLTPPRNLRVVSVVP